MWLLGLVDGLVWLLGLVDGLVWLLGLVAGLVDGLVWLLGLVDGLVWLLGLVDDLVLFLHFDDADFIGFNVCGFHEIWAGLVWLNLLSVVLCVVFFPLY